MVVFDVGRLAAELIEQTALLAALLACLVSVPLACVLPQTPPYFTLLTELRPETRREALALYPALGAIWGAWIGALVIPLDWDRPWQAYPNPCVVGACVGHSAGHLGLVAAGSSRWSQHHKLR